MRRSLWLVILGVFLAGTAGAGVASWGGGWSQLAWGAASLQVQGGNPAARGGGATEVYLAVGGAGEDLEELWGHVALVIAEPGAGDGITYHWGVFDFNQPNFVGRFIMGRMLYSMEGDPRGLARMKWGYEQRGRSLTVRRVNLSPGQAAALAGLCAANDTPGHRDYLYHYYRDNCSTRVRDLLDQATGGQLGPALKAEVTGKTYRTYTGALSARTWWLYPGLEYVLGHGVDRPLTAWEECFLPLLLQLHLEPMWVRWEDGSVHPLLGPVVELVPERRAVSLEPPREGKVVGVFLGVGMLAGALLVASTWTRVGRRWVTPVGLLGWSGLCVLAGGISTWGWVFTDHVDARDNENWLQLSPLSVGLLVASATWLVGKGRGRAGQRLLVWGAGVGVGLSVLGVALKVLPVMRQPNWTIIVLALPVHVAALHAARRMTRPYRTHP